jgi:hypothetical protein
MHVGKGQIQKRGYPLKRISIFHSVTARRFQICTLVIICVLLNGLEPCSARKDPRDANTFTFYLENDVFTGTDREYTNGIKLTWISRDLSGYHEVRTPAWSRDFIDSLPFVNKPGTVRNVSVSIGQNMYAPEDLERTDLILDDRPYAGITYLAAGFHAKDSRRMDSFDINLGIVGPHSYAEQVQKTWHKWIDTTEPKGWDHQLKDEPILNLHYERKWKLLKSDFRNGFGFDLIPHAGAALGNALTGVNTGAQARFGWHLPNDFGTFLIRPGSDTNAPMDKEDPRFYPVSQRLGCHVFAGANTSAVIRNIFLDGNTFRDSHSVDKKPLVLQGVAGVAFIVHRFKITYAYVYQTKEYDTQKEDQEYSSITVSYSF